MICYKNRDKIFITSCFLMFPFYNIKKSIQLTLKKNPTYKSRNSNFSLNEIFKIKSLLAHQFYSMI